MTKEIDFKLKVDKAASKTFTFTNDDGSVYDLTGSIITFKLYLGGSEQASTDIIGSVVLLTGKVSFTFTTTHTDNIGNYEYIIEETKTDTSLVELVKGNLIIEEEVPFTTSIDAFLSTELPATIRLAENYKQQRILYWKVFLQDAAEVIDSNLFNDTSWSLLYRMLISKLVAYDALEMAAKGAYFQFMGGSYTDPGETPGGPVKKITTGPSDVEFHDTVNALDKIFATGSGGVSGWDTLQINLCGLAHKIGVKIPMCSGVQIIIVPTKEKNPDWSYPILNDLQDLVVSVG